MVIPDAVVEADRSAVRTAAGLFVVLSAVLVVHWIYLVVALIRLRFTVDVQLSMAGFAFGMWVVDLGSTLRRTAGQIKILIVVEVGGRPVCFRQLRNAGRARQWEAEAAQAVAYHLVATNMFLLLAVLSLMGVQLGGGGILWPIISVTTFWGWCVLCAFGLSPKYLRYLRARKRARAIRARMAEGVRRRLSR